MSTVSVKVNSSLSVMHQCHDQSGVCFCPCMDAPIL